MRAANIIRIGPRSPSPVEVLSFVGAVVLGVTALVTTIHLSVFLDEVWPEGSNLYYGALGFGGLVGFGATVWRMVAPSDCPDRIRKQLYGEAFALITTGAQWGLWAVAGLSQGLTGVHGGTVAIFLTLGNAWRVFQIVRDLDAVDDAILDARKDEVQ